MTLGVGAGKIFAGSHDLRQEQSRRACKVARDDESATEASLWGDLHAHRLASGAHRLISRDFAHGLSAAAATHESLLSGYTTHHPRVCVATPLARLSRFSIKDRVPWPWIINKANGRNINHAKWLRLA